MLIELLVLIVVLALVLYVLRLWLPDIDPMLYKVAITVAVLIVIIWLLDAFGFAGGPHLRLFR
jgi:hypothetical protein